jgi:hypothetical protein
MASNEPAKAIAAKTIPAEDIVVSIARNGPAIMSAPRESRQFSYMSMLAEACGAALTDDFHARRGNWRNNPPELRQAACIHSKMPRRAGFGPYADVGIGCPARDSHISRAKMPHLSHGAFLAVDIVVWFERMRG